MPTKLVFDVLIDDTFANINSDVNLTEIGNKKVLSIINDFEDGDWRYSKLNGFIWDNIVETALSAKDRDALINKSQTSLTKAAKNLRLSDSDADDIGRGSELAEIFLYGIMKNHYSALPVVPKIFYKQNVSDNAKGADSVHIVIGGNKDFSLWFGEAKFYKSIEDARLGSIIQSVVNSLTTTKIEKENSIITGLNDLNFLINDDLLRNSVLDLLNSERSIDEIRPKLHVPILLIHECSITKVHNCMSDGYKSKIITYHKGRAEAYFRKQLEKLSEIKMYSKINFHIILFPVPEKSTVINKFIKTAEFHKNI